MSAGTAIKTWEGGCIIWAGYIHPQGYGKVHIGNHKQRSAHVVEWEKVNGPKPAGMVLDHLCRNRACVNLAHLELVTSVENVMRGFGPTAINARKTHCKHGHELAGSNLQTDHRGNRKCKQCQTAHDLKSYEKKKTANPKFWMNKNIEGGKK